MSAHLLQDILKRLQALPEEKLRELEAMVAQALAPAPWRPTVGPQLEGYRVTS